MPKGHVHPALVAQHTARRVLRKLYPRQDTLIRRLDFSWSAEVVEPGQTGPPYRTQVIAEAATPEELLAQLEALTP
jgi:hypothetical protein